MKKYLLIFALLLGAVSAWERGSSAPLLQNNRNFPLIYQGYTLATNEISSWEAGNLPDELYSPPSGDEWTLLQNKDNVKIFRTYKYCNGNEKVVLKIENNNTSKVRVSWKSLFQLSDAHNTPIDKNFSMIVEPKSTLVGDCSQDVLSVNPYQYVSTLEEGKCDYMIQDFNIEILQL